MIPKLPHGFSHPMRIGTGAFASVYRVRQEALDRWVALKFIYEKNKMKRHDLLKEAQTQANLRAECVPDVYDAFEWQGSVCMVMEWVRGVSLAQVLDADLSADARLSIAEIVIGALAEIHRLGFAHRDLKPENILLSAENGLYLVDFGFSKNVLDAGKSTVMAAKGTPAYMAPELWSHGSDVDLMRADVYAAGRVLTQILSGTPYESFPEELVLVNPRKRPATGGAVAALWSERVGSAAPDRWKVTARELTARKLSAQLFTAAKQLLFAHRTNEAYWLLVESLEEDGNNHEAVELLGRFQEHSSKKKSTMQYAVYAGLLVVLIAGAFIAGMKTRGSAPVMQWSFTGSGSLRVPPLFTALRQSKGGAAALRADTLRTGLLEGRLFVRNVPATVALIIDGDTVDASQAQVHGVPLGKGMHEVLFSQAHNRKIRSETVSVLPFQIKSIAYTIASDVQRNVDR